VFTKRVYVFPPNESGIVNSEVTSDKKISIAGLNTEIDAILAQLTAEYPRTTFFRGKENLWSAMKHWMLQKGYTNQCRERLISFVMSGIYQFWKYWLRDRKYIESELQLLNPLPIPLSLRSNIFIVFVILPFGLLIAAIGFTVENLRRFKLRKLCG